jgi:hypothetical protein
MVGIMEVDWKAWIKKWKNGITLEIITLNEHFEYIVTKMYKYT